MVSCYRGLTGQRLVYLCTESFQGLYTEISGPTLPYLIKRVDGDYEEISRALVARNIGFLSASFYGGILCERWEQVFRANLLLDTLLP